MEEITSASNSRVRRLVLLRQKAKERRQSQSFVIEGERLVLDAPAEQLEEVYITRAALDRVGERIKPLEGKLILLSEDAMAKAADTISPQGILAVARQPQYILQDLLGDRTSRENGRAPLLLILASALGCDYGWRGVLLVWLLYAVRDSRPGIAAVMIAFCLYWGSASVTVSRIFGWRIVLPDFLAPLLSPWTRLQAWAILALPLMLARFRRNVRMPAWLGYALYPAHLAVLYLLEVCL